MGNLFPILDLSFQLLPALPCQAIELGFTAGLGLPPRGLKRATVFQSVQRGIERALLDLKAVLGNLLDPLRDGVSVNWPQRHDFQRSEERRVGKECRSRW